MNDNYMAFRQKHPAHKLKKMIDLAERLKPDLRDDIMEMKTWYEEHQKYTAAIADNTMWKQMGYDKIKNVQRIMFQSPVDYSAVYFEVDKRLKIANDIKADLKLVLDENQQK